MNTPSTAKKEFKKLDAAKLKNVALSIHTRRGIGSDSGFEFVHKTFGEYLAARALVSAARRTHKRLNDDELGFGPEDAAKSWAKVIAAAEVTPFVLRFLGDEAKLAFSLDEAIRIKDDLAGVLSWVQTHGVPVQEEFRDLSFRELETYQRCTETALLATACAIARSVVHQAEDDANNHLLHIEWGPEEPGTEPSPDDTRNRERYSAARMLHRLHATTGAPVVRSLACLVLQKQNLAFMNLTLVDLERADLGGANLRGADMARANLRGAKLFRAHLRGAKLFRADLVGADLFMADLVGTDLRGADLVGTDLRGADLVGAKLGGANLVGANLRGAKLLNAALTDATLRGASVRAAIVLPRASSLEQSQLDDVKGDSETVLAKGLRVLNADRDADAGQPKWIEGTWILNDDQTWVDEASSRRLVRDSLGSWIEKSD